MTVRPVGCFKYALFQRRCTTVRFPVPGTVLFPGPIFSGTGTIQKGAKFPGPGCHTLSSVTIAESWNYLYTALKENSDYVIQNVIS